MGGGESCAQVAGTAAIIVRRCVTGANRPTGQMSNTRPLQIINVRVHFVFPLEMPGREVLSVSRLVNTAAMSATVASWTSRGGEVKAGRR